MAVRVAGQCLVDAANPADLPRAAARAARQAMASAPSPSLLVCFVGGVGRLPHDAMRDIAAAVTPLAPHAARLIVETSAPVGVGVEREGQLAVSALALDRSVATPVLGAFKAAPDESQWGRRVAEAVSARPDGGRAPRVAFAFLAPEGHRLDAIESLSAPGLPPVVGGGCQSLFAGAPGEPAEPASAAVLPIASPLGVALVSSPACRLISPWLRVEQSDGQFLLRTERGPALDLLSESAPGGASKDPVLVAVRGDEEGAPPLLRTVVGVDAGRGAVGVSEAIAPGATVAFAVRDAEAARADFQRRLAELARGLRGAAPAAGVLFTCGGRGIGLYRRRDVDAGMFRARFGDVPVAGMQSAFEIAPWGGRSRLQLFTAVAVVFYRPS